MKFSINAIVQILATIVQVLNGLGSIVPADYQWLVAGLLGIIQAVVAFLAHWANPDGTPAAVGYVKPK